jgi:hypothetical protein
MTLDLLAGLAATAVRLLVSFLTGAGEAASQKAGEDIYRELKRRLRGRAAAKEALAELERQPGDTDIQAAVRVQLRKLLQEDKPFAEYLRHSVATTTTFRAESVAIDQKAGSRSTLFGQIFGNVIVSKRSPGQSQEVGRLIHEGGVLPLILMILGAVLALAGFVWFTLSGQAIVQARDFGGFDRVLVPFFVSGAGGLLLVLGRIMAGINLHKRDKDT